MDCSFRTKHQTEILHYQSILSHSPISVFQRKHKSGSSPVSPSQVSINQIFLPSFAKVKTNAASCLLRLENWTLSVVHKTREYQSGKCADFLCCCLSLLPWSEEPLGGTLAGLISTYLGCLSFTAHRKTKLSWKCVFNAAIGWPLVQAELLYAILFTSHAPQISANHFSQLLPALYSSIALCRFPAPIWVAQGQPSSWGKGALLQWLLYLTLCLQSEERITAPVLLPSSSYNTLKGWVYSSLTTGLVIQGRAKPKCYNLGGKGSIQFHVGCIAAGPGTAPAMPGWLCSHGFLHYPTRLSCVCSGQGAGFSHHMSATLEAAPGESCHFIPAGAFKHKSP